MSIISSLLKSNWSHCSLNISSCSSQIWFVFPHIQTRRDQRKLCVFAVTRGWVNHESVFFFFFLYFWVKLIQCHWLEVRFSPILFFILGFRGSRVSILSLFSQHSHTHTHTVSAPSEPSCLCHCEPNSRLKKKCSLFWLADLRIKESRFLQSFCICKSFLVQHVEFLWVYTTLPLTILLIYFQR